ncbi:hypothetical protein MBELCI_0863 [Limimaricola cinnabarinus LL-001]|uniref:Uncharacterized protein n=1 Tax=Limimaricola cinnabarinus LL-001 TaxID=1337093 RepID=U2YJ42_9RHOB|nr:hypothetical protein MBELCI_0863 [Limimaricola cinnabarinus LL-001]
MDILDRIAPRRRGFAPRGERHQTKWRGGSNNGVGRVLADGPRSKSTVRSRP